DRHIALIELHAHTTGHEFLALVDQRLQKLALGGEPEAVINEFRIARHERIFEVRGLPVERDRFYASVGGEQDGAAGRLIDAARLHADETVLDKIEAADAVLAAE